MGKRSKSARSDAKRAERHEKREAKKKLYTGFAEMGKHKSGQRARAKQRIISGVKHTKTPCGNPACALCYPSLVRRPAHYSDTYDRNQVKARRQGDKTAKVQAIVAK